jgi:hypothetical protein
MESQMEMRMEFIASHATQGYISLTDGGNVWPVGYHKCIVHSVLCDLRNFPNATVPFHNQYPFLSIH